MVWDLLLDYRKYFPTSNVMNELEKIAERYERRKKNLPVTTSSSRLFNSFIEQEREQIFEQEIKKTFLEIKNIKVLEIGAGTGNNIRFFKKMGILPHNIYANELLPDRVASLKINHPDIHIFEGDAIGINTSMKFDIVFQSTVFTSILDTAFKQKLANKMKALITKDGIILWYDFIYDNPGNKDVKGVSKKEIFRLFSGCKSFDFFSVTLAPPIGRRVGKLYPIINKLFPFLRTHTIAIIKC